MLSGALSISNGSFCQEKNELANDSKKFDNLFDSVRSNIFKNPPYALILSHEAESIAFKIKDSLRIVKAKYASGFIYRRIDSLSQSMEQLKIALGIAKRNKFEDDEIKILNILAVAYSEKGIHDKALECHFQSIVLNERKNNLEDMAISYNNIGFVYFKLKDPDKALEFYKKSMALKKSISSTYDLDRLSINMALCYNQLKNYTEAEKLINEAFKVCKSDCNPSVLIEAEFSLGKSLKGQDRKEEAVSHFEKSLLHARKENEKRFLIENLVEIAAIKEEQKKSKEAIDLLTEAESIAIKTNFSLTLIEVYKIFYKIFNNEKNFIKSSEYQSKYIQLKDSIYSDALIKNLAKVQTNFAERENIKTIKEKNEVLVLKDKLLKKQRELSAVIVAVTLIVLTFAFILIIFQRKYSKRLKEVNLKLEEKVLERTQDLKKTNEKLERAQGDLRNFLYKTSHDIRGPVATLKGLNNLSFGNINDHVFSKELLEKKSTQIEKMIRTLSRITVVADITNTILQAVEINFVKMMDEITEFEKKNGLLKYIKISIEVEPNLKVVSDPILIRMILENMVDNSLKFFNESKRIEPYVKVSVKAAGSDAIIVVEDNGVGIEVKPNQDVFTMFMRGSEKSETGGVGLYLCKICTDRLQGTIKLEKTSKTGTTFSIRISQDATHQVMEINEALMAQLRKEEPPIIEFDQDTNN